MKTHMSLKVCYKHIPMGMRRVLNTKYFLNLNIDSKQCKGQTWSEDPSNW